MLKLKTVLVSLVLLFTIACVKNDPINAVVSITNLEENSGGSGVILRSYENETYVLTNGHVCEVTKNGGYVQTSERKYMVIDYRQSRQHDLCMIRVMGNLGVDTPVALKAPQFQEVALVYGHPELMPMVISSGRYSGKMTGTVRIGVRDCTPEDYNKYFSCLFFGKAPLLRVYEMTLISGLVAPGSSGSGVYNAQGELTNLIFAGNGDSLSYGFAVPYNYLQEFLNNEISKLPIITPNMNR